MAVTFVNAAAQPLINQEVVVATIAGPLDNLDAYVQGGAWADGTLMFYIYATVGAVRAKVAVGIYGGPTPARITWKDPMGDPIEGSVHAGGTSYDLVVFAAPNQSYQPTSPAPIGATFAGVNQGDVANDVNASGTAAVGATIASAAGFNQLADVSAQMASLPSTIFQLLASCGAGSVEAVVADGQTGGPDATAIVLRGISLPVATSYRIVAQPAQPGSIYNVTASLATYNESAVSPGGGGGGLAVADQNVNVKLSPASNSIVLRDISEHQSWGLAPSTTSPRRDDAPGPTYLDASYANPYQDAVLGAGFAYTRICAPPGSSSVQFFMTAKLPAGIVASTVVLALYDFAGGVLIASRTCVLTANYQTFILTAPVTAGLEYLARVVVEDPGLGTSVQAQAEIADVGITPIGGSGIFASSFVRYHLSPAAMTDNGEPPTNVTDRGYRYSPFSRFIFDTNAPAFAIEYWSTLFAGFQAESSMIVVVNGRPYTTITPTVDGALLYDTVQLPNGGGASRRVEIVTGTCYAPYPDMLTTVPRAIYLPAGSRISHVYEEAA